MYIKREEVNKENEEKEEAYEELWRKYIDIKTKINIPNNANKVQYLKGTLDNLPRNNITCIWVEEDNLCFFPAKPPEPISNDREYLRKQVQKIKQFKIPIDKIEYYKTKGEIVRENKISGGGGGGYSIKGAVAGALLAGGAGAIIGSRKKNEAIKSEMIEHDNREMLMSYIDNTNSRRSVYFEYSDFETLKELLPEKEYTVVDAIQNQNILKKEMDKNKSATEKIRALKSLLDDGILTEEEYQEKKKELLAKI
ncbi:hypothetical protein Amet_2835 [Alkaliphilus metalliredigens QYMF]|uniref:SHOCT domain-containing protein n=1 Tax=Alkaliphilus metalliredigens (strain QYMF) TaxID=293826 RepID=A6TS17_ALKMQ|nr:SHOCT domain-containing protein [Alkaliphilus metalliredigens]ABR48985.1 hypothetical protein Amet_2835 [Alkaliphilus metalliredigens QYMF]